MELTKEKDLSKVEDRFIEELDKHCRDNGIEWWPQGQELRGILKNAMLHAYWAGRNIEKHMQAQYVCEHSWHTDLHGSTCYKCGVKNSQCSSD